MTILAYEDRSPQAVVAMGDRIEQAFPNGCFIEGRYVKAEQVFLIALSFVAQVDQLP